MKLSKAPSAEELQVIGRFEGLRNILLAEPYREHLSKPLAYWALPSDRRLPLAFLGRTLGDLLNTPFDELSATPGIGQKKIRSFVKLLARVAHTEAAELPVDPGNIAANGLIAAAPAASPGGFDPSSVSELVWGQWQESVVRHGLAHEPLGHVAPSLKHLTRVIWNKPLGEYVGRTLQEIRALKSHGEKRVRAILEVFYGIHTIVARMGTQEHLTVRLVPRAIHAVENWVGSVLQTPGVSSAQEIFQHLICPLVEQIRIDASRQIVHLAENRLGLHGPMTSVRQAARAMGLTRARVYQLLNEINDIVQVRWPLGRHQVYELRDKFQRELAEVEGPPCLDQFHAAIELFYPGSRRGAAGPLERTLAPAAPASGADGRSYAQRGSAVANA